MPATREKTVDEYIEKRVTRLENGCLCWFRPKPGRYPVGYFRGEEIPIGRYLYEKKNGPVADGLLLRHTCDYTPCVEPDHLVPGTHADNKRDFMERHPRAREICTSAARKAAVGVQKKWDTMSAEEREEFIRNRTERRLAINAEKRRLAEESKL